MLPTIPSGNVGSATAATGYDVANSVRLDNNAYFNRTFDHAGAGGDGGTFTWTLSLWFKRSKVDGNEHVLMSRYVNANKYVTIKINGNDKLEYRVYNFGNQCRLTTTAVFRDVAAWTHFVIAQDTTGGTAGDRTKFFVNGSRVTAFDTQTNFSQNVGGDFNTNSASHHIGAYNGGDTFQGYFAQVCFVDNVQYDADQFGEFDSDSGIWKPIDVSGLSTGATSFFLDMADSGDLGDDESGESNDFTENNLAATDQASDSPTNNFATMNPLFVGDTNITYAEGNLKTTATSEGQKNAVSTIAVSSGKWYCEMVSRNGTNYPGFGIMDSQSVLQTSISYLGSSSDSYCMFQGGLDYNNGSESNIGTTWGVGSIMGVAIDLDSGTKTIKYYKAGSEIHSRTISTPANAYVFAVSHNTNGTITEINFGSPSFAISSGNADGNGYGNFEYAVPSGYYALCTKNLGAYGG